MGLYHKQRQKRAFIAEFRRSMIQDLTGFHISFRHVRAGYAHCRPGHAIQLPSSFHTRTGVDSFLVLHNNVDLLHQLALSGI
jgi:hypothetical protein